MGDPYAFSAGDTLRLEEYMDVQLVSEPRLWPILPPGSIIIILGEVSPMNVNWIGVYRALSDELGMIMYHQTSRDKVTRLA